MLVRVFRMISLLAPPAMWMPLPAMWMPLPAD
jgi:hypothetical protein